VLSILNKHKPQGVVGKDRCEHGGEQRETGDENGPEALENGSKMLKILTDRHFASRSRHAAPVHRGEK
jgi:hypothetical protein